MVATESVIHQNHDVCMMMMMMMMMMMIIDIMISLIHYQSAGPGHAHTCRARHAGGQAPSISIIHIMRHDAVM
jgi:hypothetical protein